MKYCFPVSVFKQGTMNIIVPLQIQYVASKLDTAQKPCC